MRKGQCSKVANWVPNPVGWVRFPGPLLLAVWNGACGRTHDRDLSSFHPRDEHQAASNV
jgi:hypothetical protein